MCCNPIKIKNPCKGWTSKDDPLYFTKDCVSDYIYVPCRHCQECTSSLQTGYAARIQLESKKYHSFMCTLTYNQDMVPRLTIDGRTYMYADYHDFQNLIKQIRKYKVFGSRDFKYIACSEYGRLRHRPHFHVQFLIEKKPADNKSHLRNLAEQFGKRILELWRRNINFVGIDTKTGYQKVNTRNPIYKPLCTYIVRGKNRTFDFHYVDPDLTESRESDCSWYVTKYITKTDNYINAVLLNLNLKVKSMLEYYDSTVSLFSPSLAEKKLADILYLQRCIRLIKPRIAVSKNLGYDDDYSHLVQKGIDYSISHRLQNFVFFDLYNGKSIPLPRYFRKKYLTADDLCALYDVTYHNPDNVANPLDEVDLHKRKQVSDRIRKHMILVDNYDQFEFLF